VLPGVGSQKALGYAGAGQTITAGMPLCIDPTLATPNLYIAIASSTVLYATVVGLALNGGGPGQPIEYLTAGLITIGATVVIGTPYCLSLNSGKIGVWADLVSTNWVVLLGFASTAAVIPVNILNTNIQHA
jgi:hypothetical protein